MERTVIAQQGEVKVSRISALPGGIGDKAPERDSGGAFIISHSEKGHHHVIGGDVDVIEHRTPAGMDVLYAIVREPTTLRQTAAVAHSEIALDPGIYEFRISREFDPFSEQARRVAD